MVLPEEVTNRPRLVPKPDFREVQLLVGTAIGITLVVQVRTARREIDTTTPVAEDRVAGEGVEVAVFGGDKDANWVIRDRVVTYAVAVRVTTQFYASHKVRYGATVGGNTDPVVVDIVTGDVLARPHPSLEVVSYDVPGDLVVADLVLEMNALLAIVGIVWGGIAAEAGADIVSDDPVVDRV